MIYDFARRDVMEHGFERIGHGFFSGVMGTVV
jgi:hypothetical protein